jgi:hypothetical protein
MTEQVCQICDAPIGDNPYTEFCARCMPIEYSSTDRFKKELEHLINKYSQENASNTPDFILANYLNACLEAFNVASQQREAWYREAYSPKAKGESNAR